MPDENQNIRVQGQQQPQPNGAWDPNGKASRLWYLAGIAGIGNIIALVYVLIKGGKTKILSLLYILGIIGTIMAYFLSKNEDKKLADISIKLFVGNVLEVILVFLLIGAYVFSNAFGAYRSPFSPSAPGTNTPIPMPNNLNGAPVNPFFIEASGWGYSGLPTAVPDGSADKVLVTLNFSTAFFASPVTYNTIVTLAPATASLNSAGFPTTGTRIALGNVPQLQAENITFVVPASELTNGTSNGSQFAGYLWFNYSNVSATSPSNIAIKVGSLLAIVNTSLTAPSPTQNVTSSNQYTTTANYTSKNTQTVLPSSPCYYLSSDNPCSNLTMTISGNEAHITFDLSQSSNFPYYNTTIEVWPESANNNNGYLPTTGVTTENIGTFYSGTNERVSLFVPVSELTTGSNGKQQFTGWIGMNYTVYSPSHPANEYTLIARVNATGT